MCVCVGVNDQPYIYYSTFDDDGEKPRIVIHDTGL